MHFFYHMLMMTYADWDHLKGLLTLGSDSFLFKGKLSDNRMEKDIYATFKTRWDTGVANAGMTKRPSDHRCNTSRSTKKFAREPVGHGSSCKIARQQVERSVKGPLQFIFFSCCWDVTQGLDAVEIKPRPCYLR
jgi:hypothetical protein